MSSFKAKERGFTLVELLIVIAIMMGVMGLVGGSALSTIDRAKAQTEFISVHSLIKKVAVRSFSTGIGLSLHFESDSISVLKGSELRSQKNFQYLVFEDQDINFDRNGFPDGFIVSVSVRGVARVIDLLPLFNNIPRSGDKNSASSK
ncbi:MAG: type II secretion system protein [Porticoccaceae bacterium]|nr:type II secretion system protein [Porticoccaceae bacterium]